MPPPREEPGATVPREFTITLPTVPAPLRTPGLLTVTLLLGLSEPLTARLPPLIVVAPVYVLEPARTCVPLPLMTRLIVPSPLPPAIWPLKVLVPPGAPRVSVERNEVLLLTTMPPLPAV